MHAVLFIWHVRTHITTNDMKLSCGIAKISKETQEWLDRPKRRGRVRGGGDTKQNASKSRFQFSFILSRAAERMKEGAREGKREGGRGSVQLFGNFPAC